MVHDPAQLAHTLMPLQLACELVLAKVYGGALKGLEKAHALDAIAGSIATVAPIYEYNSTTSTVSRKLSTDELAGGSFNGGGQELTFTDGRPSRRPLAVSANDISEVLERHKRAP